MSRSTLLFIVLVAASCGRSTKIEYVYVGAPAASGGSAGNSGGSGAREDGGAPGDEGDAGHGNESHAGSMGSVSAQVGSERGGSTQSARGGAAHGGATEGGSAQAGAAQSGGARGGSAQAGATHGGSAQGGSAQGGAAHGGSVQGGSAHGGSAHGGSAGAVSVAGAGGAGRAVCPATAPAVGESCSEEGRICTWGDSGLPECRTFLVCAHGQWENGSLPGVVGAEGDIGRVCHPPPAGSCPSVSPAGQDCTAALDGVRCQYSNGTLCSCLVNYCNVDGCAPLPAPEWTCNQILPPCPGKVPNAGTPCNGPDGSCTYEYSSLAAACIDGFWEWQIYSPTG